MSQAAKKYEFPSPPPVKQASVEMGIRHFSNDLYLLAYQSTSPNAARKLRKRVLLAALAVAVTAAFLTCWIQYRSQLEAANEMDQVVQQSVTRTSAPAQTASGSKQQDVSSVTDLAEDEHPIGGTRSADNSALSSSQAERLKARNRRLEALVKILRHRTADASLAPAQTPRSR